MTVQEERERDDEIRSEISVEQTEDTTTVTVTHPDFESSTDTLGLALQEMQEEIKKAAKPIKVLSVYYTLARSLRLFPEDWEASYLSIDGNSGRLIHKRGLILQIDSLAWPWGVELKKPIPWKFGIIDCWRLHRAFSKWKEETIHRAAFGEEKS